MKQKDIQVRQVDREEMRQAQAKRIKKIKRRRAIFFYSFLLILVLGIGTTLSLTVLFNIQEFVVTGNTRYSQEEIIASSGIHKNENLWRCNFKKAQKAISDTLPYINAVTIKRVLPNKLSVEVTESTPKCAVQGQAGYILIDENNRILEINAQNIPEGVAILTVSGMKAQRLGGTLEYEDEEMAGLIQKVLKAIEESEIGHINAVNVADKVNIQLTYDGRLTLKIGTANEIQYKLQFAKSTLEKLEPDARGSIDLSVLKKAVFKPTG